MENKEGDNGNITQSQIDASQAIGIDPEIEEFYENITQMEFKVHSRQDHGGAYADHHDRRDYGGAGPRQKQP